MAQTQTPITLKSIERNGWTNFARMANSIINDLCNAGTTNANSGYEMIFPASFVDQEGAQGGFTAKAVLQSQYKVDPLSPDGASDVDTTIPVGGTTVPMQPYRILIDASGISPSETDHGEIRMYIATPVQIDDKGVVSVEAVENGMSRHSGELSCGVSGTSLVPFVSYNFADKTITSSHPTVPDAVLGMANVKSHPFSYRLTITNRGFALVIWKEASDDWGNRFSWVVCQRLVAYDTGTITDTMKTGRSPVFCMYSIGGGNPFNSSVTPQTWATGLRPAVFRTSIYGANPYFDAVDIDNAGNSIGTSETGINLMRLPQIYRFTVRERDVVRPTFPVNACIHSLDNNAVVNPFQQVATYENGKYVVNLPQNFNSDRYVYKDVMDLVAYTAADVVPQWTEVKLDAIFTSKNYKYMAMHANIPNNSGMRIMILTDESAT